MLRGRVVLRSRGRVLGNFESLLGVQVLLMEGGKVDD